MLIVYMNLVMILVRLYIHKLMNLLELFVQYLKDKNYILIFINYI